jgi:cyclopropane fatty-acyl-phospholipid synthase-like methyltransferase
MKSLKHRTAPANALAVATALVHTACMDDGKPYSAASERNREPILSVLRDFFSDRRRVLEVGSGTGQHAAHFAAAMPTLEWQTSERSEHLAGIRTWLAEAALPNTPAPLELDVEQGGWPSGPYDAVFSANTLHIMGWPQVETLFAVLPRVTSADAKLAIYGPFNIDGRHTSESNAAFDASLKARAAQMGLRDVAAVDTLARASGFALVDDVAMPANNRILLWQRRS